MKRIYRRYSYMLSLKQHGERAGTQCPGAFVDFDPSKTNPNYRRRCAPGKRYAWQLVYEHSRELIANSVAEAACPCSLRTADHLLDLMTINACCHSPAGIGLRGILLSKTIALELGSVIGDLKSFTRGRRFELIR
jgi:hypothetical protein